MSSIKVKSGHAVTGSLPSNSDATQVQARPATFPASPQATSHRSFGKAASGAAIVGGAAKKKSFPPAK